MSLPKELRSGRTYIYVPPITKRKLKPVTMPTSHSPKGSPSTSGTGQTKANEDDIQSTIWESLTVLLNANKISFADLIHYAPETVRAEVLSELNHEDEDSNKVDPNVSAFINQMASKQDSSGLYDRLKQMEQENLRLQQRISSLQTADLLSRSTRPYTERMPMPPFDKHNVEAWFTQLELRFVATKTISDDEKYTMLAVAIDSQLFGQVSPAATTAPDGQKYSKTKQLIIDTFAESETQRIEKLLSNMPIEQEKPSVMLSKMRSVCKNLSANMQGIIKHRWLQALPDTARSFLAMEEVKNKDYSLDELARMADAMWERSKKPTDNSTVQEVRTKHSSEPSKIEKIELTLKKLTEQLAKLTSHRSRSMNRDSRSRSGSRSKSKETKQTAHSTCYFHRSFGSDAKQCRAPCNYGKQHSDSKNA